MILGVHTVSANKYEGHSLSPLLAKTVKAYKLSGIATDKGYTSQTNSALLSSYGLKNRLQRKASRSRKLSYWEKRFNKEISRIRYVVERTFGSCKRWFQGGLARYKSLPKVHTQHIMQSIAYNIKRSPGIIMSNCLTN